MLAAAATIRADRTTKNFIVLEDGSGRSVDELLGASTDVCLGKYPLFYSRELAWTGSISPTQQPKSICLFARDISDKKFDYCSYLFW